MTVEVPQTPKGVDREQFARAWDSLSDADKHVLLESAKHGYKPKVPKRRRKSRTW